MKGIGRFGLEPVGTKSIALQAPLDRIVSSGLANPRVSHNYFDEPLFDEHELTTVRATWDFKAAESRWRRENTVSVSNEPPFWTQSAFLRCIDHG